jgi:hypothetical protein
MGLGIGHNEGASKCAVRRGEGEGAPREPCAANGEHAAKGETRTRTPRPQGERRNPNDLFVDAPPRSSRYTAYLRYATVVVLAEQVLLLCGGHQKVINVVGDGTELLLNNRPAESGALRLEVVGLDLCRVL